VRFLREGIRVRAHSTVLLVRRLWSLAMVLCYDDANPERVALAIVGRTALAAFLICSLSSSHDCCIRSGQ